MSIRVRNNLSSLNAQRPLDLNTDGMQDSIEKLSYEYRINKSSDVAVRSSLSDKMRAKIHIFSQATRNAADGVSFLQIGEGSLSELNRIITKIRELTTQSASSAIGSVEGFCSNHEFQELGKKATRIMSKIKAVKKKFGSLKIRLTIAMNSIDIAKENFNAAQSRIKDVDSTSETSSFAQSRS